MSIKFHNHLDDPATESQMDYLKSLLASHVASLAEREPSEKGQAFIAALSLPERALTKWEASCCITALKINATTTYFKIEHERKSKCEKLTSSSTGAGLRSVFPEAYTVLYGDGAKK